MSGLTEKRPPFRKTEKDKKILPKYSKEVQHHIFTQCRLCAYYYGTFEYDFTYEAYRWFPVCYIHGIPFDVELTVRFHAQDCKFTPYLRYIEKARYSSRLRHALEKAALERERALERDKRQKRRIRKL